MLSRSIPLLLALAGAVVAQTPRILTNRAAGQELLKLPKEEDTFGFVVFGDRTGGPVEGIKVLDKYRVLRNLMSR